MIFSSHFITNANYQDEPDAIFEMVFSMKNTNIKLYKRLCFIYYTFAFSLAAKEVAKKLWRIYIPINKLIKYYKEHGHVGLIAPPRSCRLSKIPEKQLQFVVGLASNDLKELTDNLSKWTLKLLYRHFVINYEINISISSFRRIFVEYGFIFHKIEETMVTLDPYYEIKKQIIEQTKEEAKTDEKVVLSVWMRKDQYMHSFNGI
jgi:transposase